jgi:hypothetical protein
VARLPPIECQAPESQAAFIAGAMGQPERMAGMGLMPEGEVARQFMAGVAFKHLVLQAAKEEGWRWRMKPSGKQYQKGEWVCRRGWQM